MRKAKRNGLWAVVLTLCMLCVLAVPATEAKAAVKLNATKKTLYVGKSCTLKVTGTSQKVTWSSSNKSIAAVSKNGKVTAKKRVGNVTITAKYGSKKLKCKISVRRKDNDSTGFKPTGWSWTREGTEGYGLDSYTSGKYVREDGRAVLYIESSDSPDFFAYQLFAQCDGSKSSDYILPKSNGTSSYAFAETDGTDRGKRDYENGLDFTANSSQTITISVDWTPTQYMNYGTPEGKYILVREK